LTENRGFSPRFIYGRRSLPSKNELVYLGEANLILKNLILAFKFIYEVNREKIKNIGVEGFEPPTT
jgi:hypothetical protein